MTASATSKSPAARPATQPSKRAARKSAAKSAPGKKVARAAQGDAPGAKPANEQRAKPDKGSRKAATPRRGKRMAARVYGRAAPILSEAALEAALDTLASKDPAIAAMRAAAGAPPLRRREAGMAGLVWIVVGQQVSTAAANAIYARFFTAFPGFDETAIAGASHEALAACGLSRPKIRCMQALARAVLDGDLDFARLSTLQAEEAHAALCAVHGIGPWSADIFLLFCLGHADAFPAGDLALQEAARLALNLRARPDARRLEKIAERWRPLRAVAARLLWAYYRVAKNRAGMALAETESPA